MGMWREGDGLERIDNLRFPSFSCWRSKSAGLVSEVLWSVDFYMVCFQSGSSTSVIRRPFNMDTSPQHLPVPILVLSLHVE